MAFDPRAVGTKLVVVGDKQLSTGKNLEAMAKDLRATAAALADPKGLPTSLVSVESGTRSTRELLLPVVALLKTIASGVDSIKTPTVDFDKKVLDLPVIGKVTVITGITVGSTRPFRDVATQLKETAENINNITKALKTIADGVRDAGKQLPTVQARLLSGATAAEQGGKELQLAGGVLKEAGALLQL